MAPKRSGRDAAERMVTLLWGTREPPARGPKPSLSVARIVETAVDLADVEGLAAVSMHRVAERLGVTTMSLYRYVPSKDDLLLLMLDAAAAPPPDPEKLPTSWRAGLESWAWQQRAALYRHPWTLQIIPMFGPPMGPNNLGWMEAALRPLLRTGLHEGDTMGVLVILSGYVLNEVRQELMLAETAPRTGISPTEWARVYGQVLGRLVVDGRYPALAQVVAAGVFEGEEGPEEDFAYGLGFILDGVEALIQTRADEQSHQK